jgi:hypothetical protein
MSASDPGGEASLKGATKGRFGSAQAEQTIDLTYTPYEPMPFEGTVAFIID